MKKSLLIIAIGLLSCEQEDQTPVDLIPKDDMIPLIVDLQLLEEHYHRLYSRPDVYYIALDSASGLIFEEYDVTKDQFEESLMHYSTNTDTIYSIYEAALDTVNFRINSNAQSPSGQN